MNRSLTWIREPLNTHKSFLPVEAISLLSTEKAPSLSRRGISTALPEEIVMVSYEEAVLQDNADSPQKSSPPALFSVRPIH